jgi:voltage-gated potassium channel
MFIEKLIKNIKERNILIKEHIIIVLVFSFLYYKVSKHSDNINDRKKYNSFEDCLYFTIVTHFTVGFGDITPESPVLRRLCMLQIFLAYILFYL